MCFVRWISSARAWSLNYFIYKRNLIPTNALEVSVPMFRTKCKKQRMSVVILFRSGTLFFRDQYSVPSSEADLPPQSNN